MRSQHSSQLEVGLAKFENWDTHTPEGNRPLVPRANNVIYYNFLPNFLKKMYIQFFFSAGFRQHFVSIAIRFGRAC